jgi:hypothetical protein
MINGVKTWISADTEQEYAEKLLQMFGCGNAAPKVIGHSPISRAAWVERCSVLLDGLAHGESVVYNTQQF